MKPPIRRMKKADLLWCLEHTCKHRHNYISHFSCLLKEKPDMSPFAERVGYFDLETSGLAADFAFIFSYALLEEGGKIRGRVLTTEEIRSGVFDKKLVKEMCADLAEFDRIVVHYGGDRRFDAPFARTRAIKHGCQFPQYKDILISDTWLMSKNKLKLRSNKLGVICEFFGISAKQHPLTPDIWQMASAGDKKALSYIWVHNQEDVRSTQKVYHLLENYDPKTKRSI